MKKGFLLDFMWGERFLLEMEQFHDFWGYRPALPTPWKLQEDNDLKHRSKLATSWKEEEKKSKMLTGRQCHLT